MNSRSTERKKTVRGVFSGKNFHLGSTDFIDQNLKPKIRVLIVDDLKLMTEGLRAIFSEDKDIEIVALAHNGQEAIEKIREVQPDIVVLDLQMPVLGGVEATKIITKEFPKVKVLILSSFEDDSVISKVLAAGANGYLHKSMVVEDLVLAIRSINRGSCYFTPEILDNIVKEALENPAPKNISVASPKEAAISSKTASARSKTARTKKVKQPKSEKPLFPYGDWALVIFGVVVLSHTDGMGHHLGHAGLFLLMLALIARPIRVWWNEPLKHRRAIGIFAFAATVAHAIYATSNVFNGNLATIFLISSQYQWGMWAGILALALITPAAITSFQSMQRKLGKSWRQIHLLTVPALALAVIHTVLIGPDYMAHFKMETIDHLRTDSIIVLGVLTLLLRKPIFWSMLKLHKKGKS